MIDLKYVTADIHGCYKQFMQLLKKIKFSDNDTLYILGDIIDRGPEPLKMIQYVMSHENIKMLKGNHEDMMNTFFESNRFSDYALWKRNGGDITHSQIIALPEDEQKEIIEFTKNLPLYFFVDDFILVHAGIYPKAVDPDETDEDNMELQEDYDFAWIRDEFIFNRTNLKKTVIFGHTPTPFINGDIKIWHDKVYKDKICIDCGCVYGGNLACINLDTMQEIYIKNKRARR